MSAIPLLTDVVVLLGVSLGVIYLSRGLGLPAIVGFLLTGVLAGPHGLALVQSVHEVEQLAELGVILVLFAIGLEFSLAELLRMRRTVLMGGTLQVFGVLGLALGILSALGMPVREAVFLGMIASLSSTALVLRLLQQRAEVDAPHGQVSLGVLVYQDLMIVPMMLLIPVLAGTGGGFMSAVTGFGVKAVLILILVYVMATHLVPGLLARVVATRSRDMFLLAVITICLLVAVAAAAAGLSLALGAFLAGLIVSESEYSHQALSDILPFRDLFAAFFFISIGMLLNVGGVMGAPLEMFSLVVGVMGLKAAVAGLATLALGMSLRTAILAALALSQVGEFSFILAGTGVGVGLLDEGTYQRFLAVAVVSIGVTPLLLGVAPRIADAVDRLPWPARLKSGILAPEPEHDEGGLEDHVVVVGFGVNGRNVARAAGVAGIPLVAIEMNPAIVEEQRKLGAHIHYGDASQAAVLEHAGIARARVAVVAISDAAATRRVVSLVRLLNPGCHLIARTRYLREVQPLRDAGAHYVIPEELETSLEIVARVLNTYMVPQRDIEGFLSELRADGYELLRARAETSPTLSDLSVTLSELGVSTLRVDEGSPLAGRALADTDLRRLYGLTVVAIRRKGTMMPNPGGETVVCAEDDLIVLGPTDEVNMASHMFKAEGTDGGEEA